MKTKKLLSAFLASGILGLVATPSNATLMLTLNDGQGHTRTIVDGGAGDLNGSVHGILWVGSIGTWIANFFVQNGGFSINGQSNSPGNDTAWLNLGTTDLVSRGAGTLTVTLTDVFTSPSGTNLTATTQVTGINSGNSSFVSLLNGSQVSAFGPATGAFSNTSGSGVDTTGGFTMTQVATITHLGAGHSSFNVITTVPEPATLGLLGLGLIGLGLARRKTKF